jgi:hypothetical protein
MIVIQSPRLQLSQFQMMDAQEVFGCITPAIARYKQPSDYVWATDANRAGAKRGKQPVWLSAVMRDYIQPALESWGSTRRCRGTTFRHTFSRLLKGNGEDVKVVQELLRHSTAKIDVGHLRTGPESAEESGAKQGSRHDPLETKLYRRCTASFWGNPANSLIRFGVPDGI